MDHEDQRRKSTQNMELSLRKIQSEISQQLDKEKEAESNHATRQQKYDSSKEEIAARQAREAMIESHLQKVSLCGQPFDEIFFCANKISSNRSTS